MKNYNKFGAKLINFAEKEKTADRRVRISEIPPAGGLPCSTFYITIHSNRAATLQPLGAPRDPSPDANPQEYYWGLSSYFRHPAILSCFRGVSE